MSGSDTRPDVAQALENLIAVTDRRADARTAARSLLKNQGKEARVFELEAEDISAQTGLSKAACEAIDMIDELSRYACVEEAGRDPKLGSPAAAGAYFTAMCRGRHIEYCYLACLDGGKRLLSCRLLGKGTLDSAEIPVRSIAQTALRSGAKYAYLVHNHPGGGLMPSAADRELTRTAKEALALIGTQLLDHIIVTDTAWYGILGGGSA